MSAQRPLCYDCLSEDVTVKVIGPYGSEHWFCAEDWAIHEAFHERIMAMLKAAREALPE